MALRLPAGTGQAPGGVSSMVMVMVMVVVVVI
jgi:hypothetical protein